MHKFQPFLLSGHEEGEIFYLPSLVELAMELALVAAMRRVLLVDVAVPSLEFLVNGGLVDRSGTDIVGECAEQDCVSLTHVLVERHKSIEVFP